jgi:hypothetical protein
MRKFLISLLIGQRAPTVQGHPAQRESHGKPGRWAAAAVLEKNLGKVSIM